MSLSCPYCQQSENPSGSRPQVVRRGSYFRTSDHVRVQRYFCFVCRKTFSDATNDICYQQKKRHLNDLIEFHLCSQVSQRRCARGLKINLKTVARKLIFLSSVAKTKIHEFNSSFPKSRIVEFDDLETYEHTKCKPLSVTMAVEYKSRRILGFTVAQMPAKGLLAAIARKRYGFRADHRAQKRNALFQELQKFIEPDALFKSDQNPAYPTDVKRFFPNCKHTAYKGRKACVAGQGELKVGGFDPLFSLNHSFAMFRANINRLIRRTWCTTKDPKRLEDHIALYVHYHNTVLIQKKSL